MTEIILLPKDFVKRVLSHKQSEDVNRIEDLIEFRDYIRDAATHGHKDQLYKEFGLLIGMEKLTVIDHVSTIREYADDKLRFWIANGVTFGHIRAANPYQTPTPAELLDWVVEESKATGQRISIETMKQYANMGKPQRTIAQQVVAVVVKALRKFTGDWPVENRNGLEADVKSAYERWKP